TGNYFARSNSMFRFLPELDRGWAALSRRRKPPAASMPARHEPSASRQGRIKCCMPDALPGRIKSTLDGKIFGVLGRAGKQPKQFGSIHEIAALLKTNSTLPRL